MVQTFFGWLWTLLGFVSLVFPKLLKFWIGKKAGRKISWPYFILVIALTIQGIDFIWSVNSLPLRVIALIGLLTCVKFAFSLRVKVMNAFFERWSKLPDGIFRSIGLMVLAWGIYLVKFH